MPVIHCASLQKRTQALTCMERTVESGGSAGRLARAARRPHSLPEQLGLVGLAAVPAVLAYPAVSRATGLGLPCPLRTLTGVPCPLCGMTTAATSLGAGDLGAATAANPFVLLLAAGTLVMAGLLLARLLGWAPPPRPWPERARRRVWSVVAVLVATSWAFQLHRFGWT
jgi:hypothetical protein